MERSNPQTGLTNAVDEPRRPGGRAANPTQKVSASTGLRRLVERLAFLGVPPADSDDVRVQKVTLTLAALIVTVLSVVWVGTYVALGLLVSAAIPFGYQVASVVSLAAFARTKDYRFFWFSRMVLMLLLPFLLQWSLG